MDDPIVNPTMTPDTKTVVTQAQSPDAFFADRQKFWASFTGFATVAVGAIVLLLIMMRLFLV